MKKYKYYVIEEFQNKYNRWIPLVNKYYLKEYEFGENTACGTCWQETGKHGMYNKKYAKKYLADLKQALIDNKLILDKYDIIADITDFRLIEIKFKESRREIK